jgi:hypothetical protein
MERIVFNPGLVFCLSSVVAIAVVLAVKVFGAPIQTAVITPLVELVAVAVVRIWYLEHGRGE